jgi:predicted nuclease of predicted toxin-antitoxin system
VKFLVDEDLSPRLVRDLHNMGYEATSVRDRGRLGLLDHHVLEWAIAEDRIIVTANAADYRELVGNAGMHPGLWILPNVALDPASKFLRDAATLVEAQDEEPASYMFNRVVTVSDDGTVVAEELPQPP